jgi:hypothetical protein
VRVDRADDGAAPDRPADNPDTTHMPQADRPDATVAVTRAVEYQGTVEASYRRYAIDQGYERIREIADKTVTPAMRRIEAEDPERRLAGLENRLKSEDRFVEKVEFDVRKKGINVAEAVANVKDAIRYTFCYSEDRYAEGVYADCDRLEAAGYELVERRNSWTKEQYKGINSRWRVPENGQLFEVQFHTRSSFEAKEETHPAYEKLRVGVPSPAEQQDLEDFQKRVTAHVPVPPGAEDVQDYLEEH